MRRVASSAAIARYNAVACTEVSRDLRPGLFLIGRLAPSHSSNSFEYNDPAEFERADDLLVRRPIASEDHADH
jgi:hypothetical protein